MTTTAEQRRQLRRVLKLLAACSAAAMVTALAFAWPIISLGFRVRAQEGGRLDVVLSALGPPAERWEPGEFRCARGWPCSGANAGGVTLLYRRLGYGWYLHFDAQQSLARIESSAS